MKLKDIKGFEGLYGITEDGRVWSYLSNKWLKPGITRGYYYVNLCKDGKIKNVSIHRLVYKTFKGQIPKGLTVDHIDGNKINNTPDNLQLLTRGENSRKANLGKIYTEETRRKISVIHKGKKYTEETRQKISKVRKGKKHSEETRRKMAEAHRIYWAKRKLNA